ncbi:Crp/Fnr family transcriptional regulator [Sphingomonas gilva]|uniref:Crp/Fnr family transcriptional regulator n=1 Tax=Sphingomonas gilva TaxID=2305907 RepID=A0A396RSU1_9SPHN|nr:Crp/Fnr family transcriptional regulator [Sphingomonas gilva]RHW19439.1 Crp/Fnr family transcriptional regulator [Sphingomonas gilva]
MTIEPDAPISGRFLLNRGRKRMTPEERAALEAAFDGVRSVPARRTVIERGAPVDRSTLLVEGVMCRYLDDQQGHRQLLGLYIAGDFIDLHGFPLERLDHDIATITDVRIASVPRERLKDLVARHPNLARTLWFSTTVDAAMHREWIFRMGRLGATGRVAHFFSEMDARLRLAELGDEGGVPLPINQTDVAETCGLTAVHVNRVMRRLREDGLATFRSGVLRIENRKGLHRLAEFSDDYLYPDRPVSS